MRPFTPFASYHDNTGRLLVGRVRFCDIDDHPAEVFDEDGVTTLGSAVFTDSSGRLVQQPFLADHDYIVHFDKYIGGSDTMAEDDDEESWAEQGSAIDRYNTLGVSLTADSMRTVGTIDDLRTTAALSEDEILVLMGYNEAGDKDPICYKWVASSVTPDDGGSVIAVTGTQLGRWILVECPRVLDVRHFGAFPMYSVMENTQQRYRIQAAGNYAHSNGCGLYFHANGVAAFYDISGLHLYDVGSHPDAMVFCVSGVSGTTVEGIEKVYCTEGTSCEGVITLVDDIVYSSWEGDSTKVGLAPTRKLVVDSTIRKAYPTFENIEVEILVYNQLSLDHCTISSNGVITGPIYIRNGEIKTSWFAQGYDFATDLRSEGNSIRLDNCDTAQNYVILKNIQEENDYGDLNNRTVTGLHLLDGAVVRNAFFDNVVLDGDSGLIGVSGTCLLSGSLKSHRWQDCELTLTNSGSGTLAISSLTLDRGKLTVDGTTPIVQNDLAVYDAEVKVGLYVRGALTLERCKLYKGISHQCISSGVITERVVGCSFMQGAGGDEGRINISSSVNDTLVNAVWTDNFSAVENPILIDRTNIVADDTQHSYVYENNAGLFLPKKFTKTFDNVTVTTFDPLSILPLNPAANTVIKYEAYNNDPLMLVMFNPSSRGVAWNSVKLFAVGSSEKLLKAVFYAPNGQEYDAGSVSGAVHLTAKNDSGFDYGLYSRGQNVLMHWHRYPVTVPATPIRMTVDFEVL